jgi:hypothetical protein
MASADMLRLLAATVGATAASDTQPKTQQLREGLFVTALPQGPHVLLRAEVTRTETGERETITEVALSAELGRTFITLVEAALTTAEAIFATQRFAAPWELRRQLDRSTSTYWTSHHTTEDTKRYFQQF